MITPDTDGQEEIERRLVRLEQGLEVLAARLDQAKRRGDAFHDTLMRIAVAARDEPPDHAQTAEDVDDEAGPTSRGSNVLPFRRLVLVVLALAALTGMVTVVL